jgi:hypothetical protein
VPIDTRIGDREFEKLAGELNSQKFDGEFIVISWHHGRIPALAKMLGAPEGTYASPWDAKVFDRINELKYEADGTAEVRELTEDIKIEPVSQ